MWKGATFPGPGVFLGQPHSPMKTLALTLLSVDATSAALPLNFEAVVAICFVSALILFAFADYARVRRRLKFASQLTAVPYATTALRLAA